MRQSIIDTVFKVEGIPAKVIRQPKTPEEEKLSKEERVCSKCGKGKMVLRKSVYGSFLACNQYPKCRNIEKINGNNKL